MAIKQFLIRVFIITAITTLVAGCSSQNGKKKWGPVGDFFEGVFGPIWDDENPSTGSGAIVIGDQLEKVDLLTLLDPEKRRSGICTDLNSGNGQKKKNGDAQPRAIEEMQCAFNAFYTYTERCAPTPSGQTAATTTCSKTGFSFSGEQAEQAAKNLALIVRRNQVQDEIISVSENVCRRFKIALNDQITKTNFSLGTAVSTLAGLGAIFTDATTARSLAGAASIVSGIRAEYNEAYLQSLTVQVVTKGIDAKRQDVLDDINGRRYGPPFLESANEVEYLDPGSPKRKAVRYASRPYIPLSPFDKVDIALQEEYTIELRDNKRRLRNINRRLARVMSDIDSRQRSAAESASAQRAQKLEQENEWQRQRTAKTADIAAKEAEIRTVEAQIQEINDKGDKAVTADNQRKTKLSDDLRELNADLARLKAERALIPTPTPDENRAASENGGVKNCAPDGAKNDPICVALTAAIAETDTACKASPVPEQNAERCEAYKMLSAEQRLQCVPNTALPAETKALCENAGLLKKGTAVPTTAATEPAQTTPPSVPSSSLVELEAEKESLDAEKKRLDTRIETLEELFKGELAKVDALVGVVPISQYTVEMAVADAIRFHAACTIPSGLEKAADSVEKIRRPGFETVQQGLDNMINIQKKVNQLELLRRESGRDDTDPQDGSGATGNQ